MIVESDGIVSLERENALFTKQRNDEIVCDEERKENMFYFCWFVPLYRVKL